MSESKHSISLKQARKMTAKYRDEKKKVLKEEYSKKDVLPFSETFERAAFDRLLAQPGCVGIRAYYSMDDESEIHLIFAGINENGKAILPVDTEIPTFQLLENGGRCPPNCPPPGNPDDPDL